MMIETALVFDKYGDMIYWHKPSKSNMVSIPDSRKLWDVLWTNRDWIGGVAHTHPWNGIPLPSTTDVTTFAAVETGLGKNLIWPIVTMNEIRYFCRGNVHGEYIEMVVSFHKHIKWINNIKKLRLMSSITKHKTTE